MDVRPDGAALARILHSPDGPVGRAVFDGATRLQEAARVQVGKDTRDLERSIVKRPFTRAGEFGVRVGSDRPYALLHHEGTDPHLIVPRKGKALRFPAGGGLVFARRVNHPGTRPNRFLVDNLRRALP